MKNFGPSKLHYPKKSQTAYFQSTHAPRLLIFKKCSLELPIGHDGDVVPKNVCLLHGVSGHDGHAALLHTQNQVPNVATDLGVHSCAGQRGRCVWTNKWMNRNDTVQHTGGENRRKQNFTLELLKRCFLQA